MSPSHCRHARSPESIAYTVRTRYRVCRNCPRGQRLVPERLPRIPSSYLAGTQTEQVAVHQSQLAGITAAMHTACSGGCRISRHTSSFRRLSFCAAELARPCAMPSRSATMLGSRPVVGPDGAIGSAGVPAPACLAPGTCRWWVKLMW